MPAGHFSQTDPFGFSAAFLSVGKLFASGLSLGGNPATGNLWANVPQSTVAKLRGGAKLVVEQVPVTKVNAPSFARFFATKSNAAQIPWILGPAGLLPVVGTAITIAASTLDGLQRISQGAVNASQLAVLMADGGRFLRTLALDGTDRIVVTVLYAVNVGNEPRLYGVCSSTYGLNVVA